jgi:uncharacterized membrane protein
MAFVFTLLVLVYCPKPTVYLIEISVMNINVVDAVPATASLLIGWFIYELLRRSWFGRATGRLTISGFIPPFAATYGYTHVFSGRGAFIQVGSLDGSIIAANGLFIIIPGQCKLRWSHKREPIFECSTQAFSQMVPRSLGPSPSANTLQSVERPCLKGVDRNTGRG